MDCNDIGLGQSIGDTTSTCQIFLGTVARNRIYFPVDVEFWNKVTDEQKKNAWDYINNFFEVMARYIYVFREEIKGMEDHVEE